MNVSANIKGKQQDGGGVVELPLKPLVVPIRDETDVADSIACGFRQSMLELKDQDGNGGEVGVGAGLGSDFIQLEWKDGDKDRMAILRGSEILRAWVATFDPEAAANFPDQIKVVDS